MTSLLEVKKATFKRNNTLGQTHLDLPVGTPVRVITPISDFHFFYGETGYVIESKPGYLGMRVRFDEPRVFKDGTTQEEHIFDPEGLKKIRGKKKLHCATCKC